MENRLYVTNLSDSASLTSLRQCFSACGEVSQIEFVAERQAYRTRPSAFVTMATSAGAEQAVRRLNGSLLDGRSLMVSVAPAGAARAGSTAERGASGAGSRGKAVSTTIAITLQYRERHNMTYELDYAGVRLTLRIFFPPAAGEEEWRIEARSNGNSEVIVDRAAPTRALALAEIADAWQTSPAAPPVDWQAVTSAMKAVRAI